MPSQTIHFPTEQYTTVKEYADARDITFSKAVSKLVNRGVGAYVEEGGFEDLYSPDEEWPPEDAEVVEE
jgi:hypothetical protein